MKRMPSHRDAFYIAGPSVHSLCSTELGLVGTGFFFFVSLGHTEARFHCYSNAVNVIIQSVVFYAF